MNITSDLVREFLHYDTETGVFTWRARDRKWFKNEASFKKWNTRRAGQRAGSEVRNRFGYARRSIRIFQRHFYEHHLAWIYMEGLPLPRQIDHINRDACDNRWVNLRPSSSEENHKNKSMNSRNTSGVNGVSWSRSLGKWRAEGCVRKKRKHIGYFGSLDEASRAVDRYLQENGFDPSHGKDPAPYMK